MGSGPARCQGDRHVWVVVDGALPAEGAPCVCGQVCWTSSTNGEAKRLRQLIVDFLNKRISYRDLRAAVAERR